MKLFAVILMICVLRACSSDSTTSDEEERVVPGKYSSHVVIKLTTKNFYVCEGVLFAKNYVLTAAGCVQKYNSKPKSLEVVAGIISTENIESEKNAQIRKVSNVILHEEWSTSKHDSGDIAILKVSPSFDINEYVNISGYGGAIFVNDTVRIVGYGDDENLIHCKLRVPPAEECNDGDVSVLKSYISRFCAKFKYNGYEQIFWKDSFAGAPVLCDDVDESVCGVMSVNNRFITYVNHYAEWIEITTGINQTKNFRENSTESSSSDPTTESITTSVPDDFDTTTSDTTPATTTQSTTDESTAGTEASTTTAPDSDPTTTTAQNDSDESDYDD